MGCDGCTKNSKCKRPCKTPHEFWGVQPDSGSDVEIAVNQVAAKAFSVTVKAFRDGEVKCLHQTSRIFRSTSADGTARRLMKRRYPNARVTYWNQPAYADLP